MFIPTREDTLHKPIANVPVLEHVSFRQKYGRGYEVKMSINPMQKIRGLNITPSPTSE